MKHHFLFSKPKIGKPKKIKHLKKTAVPSLFLYNESNSEENYENSRSENLLYKNSRNVPRKAKSEALLLVKEQELSNDSISKSKLLY